MKRKFASLSFLLAAICIFGMTSCGEKGGQTPDESGNVTSDSTEISEIEEKLGVPLTADYGNYEFNILTAGNVAYEDFTVTEESSLALDNAQYKRKRKVEEDYNVKIKESVFQATSSGGGPGYTKLAMAANSGECPYDLALVAGYDVSVLAYNGYLYDLNSVPGIDLSKSWWDQKANESLCVRGVNFFTTGEITVSDNIAAFVVYFNKKLAADYNIENPYQLVYDGTWTMDKFIELCKTVSEDLNQDGKMDLKDRYGLLIWDDSVLGIVNAAGQRCCTINSDGKIELTIYTEETLSALEKYFSLAFDTQHAITYQRSVKSTAQEQEFWMSDHGLFWVMSMKHVPVLREMESDFGILPYPKLSEAQENYYSTVGPYSSQFICVPLIQDNVERTGVITEALAYYGKTIVTPAYYDISLIGQGIRDEESSDMLDIIFSNLVYDIGYYYQIGPYNKNLIYMIREFDTNFTSRYEKYRAASENLLTVINEYYGEAVSEWQK